MRQDGKGRRPFEGKWEDEDRFGTPEARLRTLAEFEAARKEILAMEPVDVKSSLR